MSRVQAILDTDSYLEPYKSSIERRVMITDDWLNKLNSHEGGIENFALGYLYYGFNVRDDNTIVFREWAPNATRIHLFGEFNDWNRHSHALVQANSYGAWEIVLPAQNGKLAISNDTKIKLAITLPDGQVVERIPTYIRRVVQDTKVSPIYDGVFWHPEQPYQFKHSRPDIDLTKGGIKIYEAHVGISTPEEKVGSYKEFTANVLPHIKSLGYNAIQLMAIMEHAYYGSFGYQITSCLP